MKAFLQICHVGRYVRTPETQGFRTVGCDRPQLSKDILLKYQKTLVYMCLIYKHTHTHTHTHTHLTYIIHSGFISGYQNRYGDNLKPPTNVYHRMTA